VTTAQRRRVWADPRYADRVRRWEPLSSAATPDLLQRLAPQPGERLLDVGCGAGAATFAAATLVGPQGTVVGADVSTAVVQAAAERAAHLHAGNVTFEVADMQTARVAGGPFDAALSQFGVMFFDDPVAAFANIRDHLRPGGRLCFSCWQPAGGNPWSYAALITDLIRLPTGAEHQPGPFSLAHAAGVVALLEQVGFNGVEVSYRRANVDVAREAVVDDVELTLMGVPTDRIDDARERVASHLATFETAPRTLRLPIAYLIVIARNDGGERGGSLEWAGAAHPAHLLDCKRKEYVTPRSGRPRAPTDRAGRPCACSGRPRCCSLAVGGSAFGKLGVGDATV
jgi:SAM-dependent methyltransferase